VFAEFAFDIFVSTFPKPKPNPVQPEKQKKYAVTWDWGYCYGLPWILSLMRCGFMQISITKTRKAFREEICEISLSRHLVMKW